MDDIKIIRSARKTLAIEVKPGGSVIARAPFWMSRSTIFDFVSQKENWIRKKIKEMEEHLQEVPFEQDELDKMRERVRGVIKERLPYWEEITGLSPKRIKITSARKRFGSCSSKGNICFSIFLDGYDSELVDFVIVHELCHLKVMNHSSKFYNLLDDFMPDWREREKRLKTFSRSK